MNERPNAVVSGGTEGSRPCRSASATECPSYGGNFKSKYVLEVNAGIARKNGLKTGDTLDF
jgi:uncharacterized membrane protein (UPF0127 family)